MNKMCLVLTEEQGDFLASHAAYYENVVYPEMSEIFDRGYFCLCMFKGVPVITSNSERIYLRDYKVVYCRNLGNNLSKWMRKLYRCRERGVE